MFGKGNPTVRTQSAAEQIIIAARKGSSDELQLLIGAEADVNKQDDNGCTALMVSCSEGHVLCTRALVAIKAELEKTDQNGVTALMFSAHHGHDQCAQALIEVKADLDKRTHKRRETALMKACARGHDQCTWALIEAQANIEAMLNGGFTALMLSCEKGHDQCTQALIEAKADFEVTQNLRWSTSMDIVLKRAKAAIEEARTVVLSVTSSMGEITVTCTDLAGNQVAMLHFNANMEMTAAMLRTKILESMVEPQGSALHIVCPTGEVLPRVGGAKQLCDLLGS